MSRACGVLIVTLLLSGSKGIPVSQDSTQDCHCEFVAFLVPVAELFGPVTASRAIIVGLF